MEFGPFPLDQAEGVILAHTTSAGDRRYKKGHRLAPEDLDELRDAGLTTITGAKLSDDDVHEDDAAHILAECLCGPGVRLSPAKTGRCNLMAERAGVVLLDREKITRANMISEDITVATVPPKSAVAADQIVATVKIIPFAVPAERLQDVLDIVTDGETAGLSVASFMPLSYAIISTVLPHLKDSVIEKTDMLTRERVAQVGGEVIMSARTAHAEAAVADALLDAVASGADMVLVAAASATVDRNDEVPRAILRAGGRIKHFGMPVDPGNLLVLGEVDAKPVLVLPGCARSPKLNGLDWVMQRLAAGLSMEPEDIQQMGVGGLLVDTPVRPLPRSRAVEEAADTQAVTAVLLAAGQSRRMGDVNKLLEQIDGVPAIRRIAEMLVKSKADDLIVVTGYESAKIEAALEGLTDTFIFNPDYAGGLSTSVKAGIKAVPEQSDGAIVVQGDMPLISVDHINRLIDAFDPETGATICVPVHNGKRGNPVVWPRDLFPAFETLAGDVGAKHLIGENEALVKEVEFEDTSIFEDLDTPEQWAVFRAAQPDEIER